VLSRYILRKKDYLDGKQVLELGTGVGIAGITTLLQEKADFVMLTDYNNNVLQNTIFNMKLNKAWGVKSSVLNLDWRCYKKFEFNFDLIIGSDIVYEGCPLQELYELIKKALKPKG